MKKLFALMIALTLALLVLTPALAETADTATQEAAEVADSAADAAETADTAAEEVTDEADAAAEEVTDEADAAAEEVAEAAEAPAEDDAVAEEEPAGSAILEKLAAVPWYAWVIVAALVVAGALLAMSAKKTAWNSRRLAMGAMCIAIAFVLSCVPLFRLPQGGMITPASMLPLIMFMLAAGPLQGLVVGCAFGFLMLITDPYVIHPIQLLVDYPLAYGAMILGCVAAALPIDKRWKLPVAAMLAGLGRYVMAVLSGAIFFAEYAGEQNAWVYSLAYNISYLGPDVLVCMLVACVPGMARLVDVIRAKK